MLFHSPVFLVFFAGYFMVQLAVPPRHRLWLILVGGTLFYAYWNPLLTWLPWLLAMIGWGGARWIAAAADTDGRRRRLVLSLILLGAPLVLFKYTNFLYRHVLGLVLPLPEWSSALPLPLGISFVTFTMIAYVVDVYRGVYPLERRAPMVGAYALFFPHLIAGPILRPRELIPQLDRPRPALDINATLAVLLFTVGLVKKVVFANQLGEAVDLVYGGGPGLTAADYVLAIYGFSLQIYCDFSGYTDMAIGLALLLGVRLPNNFRQPYNAISVADFWRRWHRTLSFWLRDYIYIPLGGNRAGPVRRWRNTMITMMLGGLWHGASWTFVLWGALHGALIVASRRGRLSARHRLRRIVAIVVTFHLVTLLWILFRAPDLGVAARVALGPFRSPIGNLGAFAAANAFSLALLGLFVLWHPFDTHGRLRYLAMRMKPALLWPATAVLWMLVVSLSTGSSAKFIYFDF